ncbi:MAG: LacI family DNA-binding transcriptional regulator [Anaerolineae bacterium]|nr:LacI family DNA-binding transcriptional regulator [Anaerolineae bacterium]
MAVTLKDLAEHVGRSVTTVSRALAGYDDVSPHTRDQVVKAAQELGYEPNTAARQLQKRRSDTLVLILPPIFPHISDPFFSELISGVVEQSNQHGLTLLVSSSPGVENQTDFYLKFIRSRQADGFILIRTERQDPRIELLQEQDYPFVAFGRTETNNDYPFVDDDGEAGIGLIVNHLVELGHTRLAFIAEPLNFTIPYHRFRGFKRTLESHGLPLDDSLVVEGGYRQRFGQLAGHQLLDRVNPPTAIVTCNDLLTLGAMKAAQERNLTIGQDVSITGYDDIMLAEFANPSLTTIHLPAHKIGTTLCKMLANLLEGKPLEERQIILQPELVVRQSTGPVKE